MTKLEKMQAIAEILEVEPDEISEEMKLDDFDTWDSVAVLGVIAFRVFRMHLKFVLMKRLAIYWNT